MPRIEYIVDEKGEIVWNLLDREGENCALSVTQAQRLGTVTNEEVIGPDCDTVHEGVSGGG